MTNEHKIPKDIIIRHLESYKARTHTAAANLGHIAKSLDTVINALRNNQYLSDSTEKAMSTALESTGSVFENFAQFSIHLQAAQELLKLNPKPEPLEVGIVVGFKSAAYFKEKNKCFICNMSHIDVYQYKSDKWYCYKCMCDVREDDKEFITFLDSIRAKTPKP